MIIYVIKAVKYDAHDVPTAVIWQQADAQANEWIGEEYEVEVNRVIQALDNGYKVYLEWFANGRSTMGPLVRKTKCASGRASIESTEAQRALTELPYFD